MAAKESRRERVTLEERLENAHLMLGAAMATAFASILTIIGSDSLDDPCLHLAAMFFAFCLPLIGQYLIATGKLRENFRGSPSIKWVALMGMLLFLAGMGSLLWAIESTIGIAWIAVLILVMLLLAEVEKKCSRKYPAKPPEDD